VPIFLGSQKGRNKMKKVSFFELLKKKAEAFSPFRKTTFFGEQKV
jgi:hypothetical protein